MKPAIQTDTVQMYGGPEHGGWSGTLAYDPAVHEEVAPCPFCGSEEVEINNTHTPYYWLECQGCNARMDADSFDFGRMTTEREWKDAHTESMRSAIANWNARVNLG